MQLARTKNTEMYEYANLNGFICTQKFNYRAFDFRRGVNESPIDLISIEFQFTLNKDQKLSPTYIIPNQEWVYENSQTVLVKQKPTSNKELLFIIGTPDQFIQPEDTIAIHGSFYEYNEGSTIPVLKDDPIVLKPVKHGFIVVDAWGEEAKLPEIQNSSNN